MIVVVLISLGIILICEHRFLAQDLQHEDPDKLYYLVWN